MFYLKLGFKYKLLLAIVFTFIGFVALSSLSVHSIKALITSSEEVDQLGQQQALLNRLQLSLLQTTAKLDDQTGQSQDIQQVSSTFVPSLQESPLMRESNQKLIEGLIAWSDYQQQRLILIDQLGKDDQAGEGKQVGVKGDVIQALADLENALFVIFRKPFQKYRLVMLEMMKTGDDRLSVDAEQHMAELIESITLRDMGEYLAEPLQKAQASAKALTNLLGEIRSQKENAQQVQTQLLSQIQENTDYLQNALMTARNQANASSEGAIQKITAGGSLVALLVLALLLVTWRQATRTLTQTVKNLELIASGDFTHKLKVTQGSTDEFDRLGHAVNDLTSNLSDALDQISQSSTQVQGMTGQLKGTLEQLTESNEQTGSQAQTVAAAVEQISVTVQQMTGATDDAHRQATQACETADASGAVITTALGALDHLGQVFDDLNQRAQSLEAASSRVDGVTDMINGLAEQTNLLALNAAIEAARAGEAGRGFSVVADEVRALAEKTVQATSDINGIVGDMKQQLTTLMQAMNKGASQVNQSQTLSDKAIAEIEKIKGWVLQVSECNNQLATSINDVALTAQEINSSMVTVAGNVDKNVAHSRDVLSFAGEVGRQTDDLESITQRFRCN